MVDMATYRLKNIAKKTTTKKNNNNICGNLKCTKSIIIKLEIWVDGSMKIMHTILSSTISCPSLPASRLKF
jgi:hypothetical protein